MIVIEREINDKKKERGRQKERDRERGREMEKEREKEMITKKGSDREGNAYKETNRDIKEEIPRKNER